MLDRNKLLDSSTQMSWRPQRIPIPQVPSVPVDEVFQGLGVQGGPDRNVLSCYTWGL